MLKIFWKPTIKIYIVNSKNDWQMITHGQDNFFLQVSDSYIQILPNTANRYSKYEIHGQYIMKWNIFRWFETLTSVTGWLRYDFFLNIFLSQLMSDFCVCVVKRQDCEYSPKNRQTLLCILKDRKWCEIIESYVNSYVC